MLLIALQFSKAVSNCFLICFSWFNLPASIWVYSVPIIGFWVSNFALSLKTVSVGLGFLMTEGNF